MLSPLPPAPALEQAAASCSYHLCDASLSPFAFPVLRYLLNTSLYEILSAKIAGVACVSWLLCD